MIVFILLIAIVVMFAVVINVTEARRDRLIAYERHEYHTQTTQTITVDPPIYDLRFNMENLIEDVYIPVGSDSTFWTDFSSPTPVDDYIAEQSAYEGDSIFENDDPFEQ